MKVINFFKKSYQTDKTAFYAEILETILLVSASAILTFTVLDPATHIFIPLYLLGSMLAVFSTYRRGSSALLLTLWFTAMNSVALVQLIIAGVYW
jgi:hypothetical protein